jgi:hypothetical protein
MPLNRNFIDQFRMLIQYPEQIYHRLDWPSLPILIPGKYITNTAVFAGPLAESPVQAGMDVIWNQLFPAEQARIVNLLVEKVIVSPTNIELRLRANGIEQVVMELQPAMAVEEVLA